MPKTTKQLEQEITTLKAYIAMIEAEKVKEVHHHHYTPAISPQHFPRKFPYGHHEVTC